jgi:hypothetical protein
VVGKPATSLELSGPDGEPLGGFDWPEVQRSLMAALAPYAEARVAVALTLKQLQRIAADAPAD